MLLSRGVKREDALVAFLHGGPVTQWIRHTQQPRSVERLHRLTELELHLLESQQPAS
jgi:hypothetical protein